MGVKQISIFLENKQGRLLAVTECLGKHNINIRALTVADTSDFGILRMIVINPDEALKVLKENDFTASINEVTVIEVPDIPGGFNSVLQLLSDAKVNVEYTYAFCKGNGGNVLIVFRVNDQEGAAEVLKKAGIKTIDGNQKCCS